MKEGKLYSATPKCSSQYCNHKNKLGTFHREYEGEVVLLSCTKTPIYLNRASYDFRPASLLERFGWWYFN